MATPQYISEPVSRGAAAAVGVVQNFGTAIAGDGGTGGGVVSANRGGIVDNGGQSMQQAAVAPSATLTDIYNTPAPGGNTESSRNPVVIQDDSTAAATNSEYVVRTTPAQIDSTSAGYHTDSPKSDVVAELPAYGSPAVREVSATFGGDVYQNPAKGYDNARELGSLTNLDVVANEFGEAVVNPNKKQNGAATVGSPSTQLRNETTDQGAISSSDSFNPSVEVTPANAGLAGEFTGIQS